MHGEGFLLRRDTQDNKNIVAAALRSMCGILTLSYSPPTPTPPPPLPKTVFSNRTANSPQSDPNPSRHCASKRVGAPTSQQTFQTSQSLKNKFRRGRVSLPLPPPTAPARWTLRSPGVLRPVLANKICWENRYFLFVDPSGSDQSRHVDDNGAKIHNLDAILGRTRFTMTS